MSLKAWPPHEHRMCMRRMCMRRMCRRRMCMRWPSGVRWTSERLRAQLVRREVRARTATPALLVPERKGAQKAVTRGIWT